METKVGGFKIIAYVDDVLILDNVYWWAQKNDLIVNTGKTELVLFTRKCKVRALPFRKWTELFCSRKRRKILQYHTGLQTVLVEEYGRKDKEGDKGLIRL